MLDPIDRPIVFLDVDGVLNHYALYASRHARGDASDETTWIDPACVARVQAICDRTRAAIVISSSWREIVGVASTVATLRHHGLTADVLGGTPTEREVHGLITIGRTRWAEIRAWLDTHAMTDRFVVIDDAADSTPAEVYVRTDIAVGITDADVERAVAILRGGA